MCSPLALSLLISAASALEEHGQHAQHALAPKAAGETRLSAPQVQDSCSGNRTIPDLFVGEYWDHYNLGDLVQYYNTTEYFNNLRVPQGNSLVEDYMHRTRGVNDMYTLARLVEERAAASQNAFSDSCSIHVRAGDVIECEMANVTEMLDHQVRSRDGHYSRCAAHPLWEGVTYVRPLSYYDSALSANMSVTDCPDVVIVSGSNIDLRPFPRSSEYLSRLRDHLCDLGYRVQMQCGASPDEDMVTLATSRAFLSSGGGFSRVVNNVRDALHELQEDPSAFDSYNPNTSFPLPPEHTVDGGRRRP